MEPSYKNDTGDKDLFIPIACSIAFAVEPAIVLAHRCRVGSHAPMLASSFHNVNRNHKEIDNGLDYNLSS